MKFIYVAITVIFFIFFVANTNAQTFYRVTHTTGTVTAGGIPVTVVPINSPTSGLFANCSESGPYGIGRAPGLPNNSGYSFRFASPVGKIKFQLEALDSAETIEVYINGSFYNLSGATITPLTCAPTWPMPIVSGGVLTTLVSLLVDAYGMVELNPGFPVDTIRIMKNGVIGLGVSHSFYFAKDTFVVLNQPFNDTSKCAGDSLYISYKTTSKFSSSNIFYAELSNASGSFSSPTIIGSFSSDTTGVIPCRIPLTAVGSGYRIRIRASLPYKLSLDNGKNISIGNIYPSSVNASSNTPVCQGNTLNLTSSSATSGTTYKWSGPNGFNSTAQNPNVSNAPLNSSGNYILTATYNGCSVKDTATVLINPVPSNPIANSNNPVCIGGTLNLTANSTSGANYSWTGPAGFTSSIQNPTIISLTPAQAGTYTVIAELNGCTSVASGSTTVSVVSGPSINIYPSPKDTICSGATLTLNANIANAGTGASFQWYKNGIVIGGATASKYVTNSVNNGDVFRCELIPSSGSACNTSINSISIPITVLPYLEPKVEISVTPDTNVWSGVMVTFTANHTDAGSKPGFQWKINNKNVIGAISNTWGATTLNDKDVIGCYVTSNYLCPLPKSVESNTLTIHVATSIENINNVEEVKIYPNPAKDRLYILCKNPKDIGYKIVDITGRIQKEGRIKSSNHIDISGLHDGTYTIKLNSVELKQTFIFYKISSQQ